MISRRSRWIGLTIVAVFTLPLLAACGGNDTTTEQFAPTDNAVAATTVDSTADGSAGSTGDQAVQVDFAPEIGTIDNWYNGESTSLADLRGQPVLLVFWADY